MTRVAAGAASPPLAALRVVSLDTETTGLDVATARIVQVAAVRLTGPRIATDDRFESLVRPDVPIPRRSTGIHGISDADVAGAPLAAQVLAALAAFLDDDVVIGHAVRFDLEMLRCEAARAGLGWREPRALDVRALARIAVPELAGDDLDTQCRHFGIEIEGRHSALGDAMATARLYGTLLPQLRQRGIRSLAEAEAAVHRRNAREATASGSLAVRAGPAVMGTETEALSRVDSFPYRHRVAEVMSAPPLVLPAETSLGQAAARLVAEGVSSVFVENQADAFGIVTERDVLRAVEFHGGAALALPLGELQSTPLQTVRGDDLVYRAIGRMDRLGIRHLGVVDAGGTLVGVVTTRNLLRHRATTAMILGDELAAADDEAALARAWSRLPLMAERLLQEGVDARSIAAVISAELRTATRRAAEIGIGRLGAAGQGEPPAPFVVLVLGSAGREESLLSSDQDNAIVYDGEAERVDDWFAELGRHIADILDAAGVPYCSGGVMAREAAWRQSLDAWKATVDGWIGRQRPEDLLFVDIFFDAVPVCGERRLGNEVWSYACRRGAGVATFRQALAESLADWRSGVGAFGRFRLGADGRIDLKLAALMPIFTAARVLALKAGAEVRGTPERLRAAAAAGLASETQIEALVEAHGTVLAAILREQIADAHAGVRLGPRVDPTILDKAAQAELRAALRRVSGAIDLAREGMI